MLLNGSSLAKEILRRDRENICKALYSRQGLAIKRAYDVYLEDVEGRKYLDFTAGGVTAVGYSHPNVVDAVVEQARNMLDQPDLSIGIIDLRNDLAEEIKGFVPAKLSDGKIAFGHSGSDIIERAIRIARFATQRPMVISYFEAHHGASPGALSASPTLQEMGSSTIARFFQLPGFLYMPFPDPYRPWFGSGTNVANASLAFLERLLSSTISPQLVAGVLVEPVLSYGGNVVPPDGYFEGLSKICERHEIPLVSDEVLTGIGKTGRMFALEHWHVWPDVLCLGKALSGSLPLSMFLATRELADKWNARDHVGMSKDGHVLGCAMALAILRTVREMKLVQRAERMGQYLSKRLHDLKEEQSVRGDIRGLGLMQGFDLVQSEESRTPDGELARRIVDLSLQKGLIIGTVGVQHNVLRFMPSLTVTEEHIDTAMEVLTDVLRSLNKQMGGLPGQKH